MISIARKAYRTILPPSTRDSFWRLRDESPQKLRQLLWRSQKKVQHFGRYLTFRLTGHCNACRGKHIVRYKNPALARLPFSFYRCRDCEFIFVAPLPDISSYYDVHTMPDFGEGEEIWNTHYLSSIEKYARGRGKILEVGFGNASFLRLAHNNGWEVHGAELSRVLVQHAREAMRLPNIELGSIEEIGYPDNFFDVVAGFNFIEHVPDPRKILSEIRRILRPSGIVAVMCPNISGIYHLLVPEILADNDPLNLTWIPPDHISYFNKNNLKLLLEDVGFAVVGDESHWMSSLWRQHEVNIGPKVTGEKLEGLLSEIRSSSSPKGDGRVLKYRPEIKRLLVERMAWTMISDLIELEPALGAENAILFLAEKVGN